MKIGNNSPDIDKVKWHLQHGDGYKIIKKDDPQNQVGGDVVNFQGRDYLGYDWYFLTKEIRKALKDYEKLFGELGRINSEMGI